MRIGYTGWTWISNEYNGFEPINDRHKENFERFLRDVSDLGYETVENFNWIADYYADDIEGFKAVVAKYNLKFENLYFYFSEDPEKDYQEALRYLEFMKAVDAHYMNMQGCMWSDAPFERPLDREKILSYAALSNRIGKACKEAGVKACMHPTPIPPCSTRQRSTCIWKTPILSMYISAWIPPIPPWPGCTRPPLSASTASASAICT